MKALTLWQPWASLIALGFKTIETRSWPAPNALIGQRIAIHAAKRYPEPFQNDRIGDFQFTEDIPLGAVLATALLVDCAYMCDLETGEGMPDQGGSPALYLMPDGHLHLSHHFEVPVRTIDVTDQLPYGNFAPGRWAWLLDNIEQLDKPLPATGRQGLWEIYI